LDSSTVPPFFRALTVFWVACGLQMPASVLCKGSVLGDAAQSVVNASARAYYTKENKSYNLVVVYVLFLTFSCIIKSSSVDILWH